MDPAEASRLSSLIDGMTLSEIDSNLARLSEVARLLKARRNKLCPITVLHDDLLLDIFLRLPARLVPMLPLQRRYRHPSNADRMHVSHVSKRWRELALSSATMWAEPSFNVHPAFTAEMLCRAGEAPLVLFIADPYNSRPSRTTKKQAAVICSAFQKAEHLKEFTLACDQGLLDQITPFTLGAMPLLERASLYLESSRETLPTIDEVLGSAPRLRVLSIRHLNISGSSPLLANLTELILDLTIQTNWMNTPVRTPPSRPTVSDMDTLLRHATSLRVLKLIDALPTLDASYEKYTSFEKMLNLQLLSLADFLDPIAGFLARLVAPHLETRDVKVTLPWHPDQAPLHGPQHLEASGVTRLTAVLARHLALCPAQPFQSATLLSPDTIIEAWTAAPTVGSCSFRLEIDCICPGMAHSEHGTVGFHVLQLPIFARLAALTYLPEFAYVPNWTAQLELRALQDALPALRTLQLGSYTLPYLPTAAPMRYRGVPADIQPILASLLPTEEYTPFPELETIVLENFIRSTEVFDDLYQLAVSALLAERRAFGRPIKNLKLHAAVQPSEESLERWRAEAEEVNIVYRKTSQTTRAHHNLLAH